MDHRSFRDQLLFSVGFAVSQSRHLLRPLLNEHAPDHARQQIAARVVGYLELSGFAERGSRMGLPEALYNLFPGTGGYSLLCRHLGAVRAQSLIISGRLYEDEKLEELGLIDLVVDAGGGPAAVPGVPRA